MSLLFLHRRVWSSLPTGFLTLFLQCHRQRKPLSPLCCSCFLVRLRSLPLSPGTTTTTLTTTQHTLAGSPSMGLFQTIQEVSYPDEATSKNKAYLWLLVRIRSLSCFSVISLPFTLLHILLSPTHLCSSPLLSLCPSPPSYFLSHWPRVLCECVATYWSLMKNA